MPRPSIAPYTNHVIPNEASRRFFPRLAPARRSACAVRNLSSSCIGQAKDPRSFGKPGLCSAALQGGIFDSFRSLRPNTFRLSRYRLRDYRIICQLQQGKFIVLVVAVGHRSIVYDD